MIGRISAVPWRSRDPQTDHDRDFDGSSYPQGDACASESREGRYPLCHRDEGYLITPYDPAIAEQLDAGREFMKEYRNSFKALAK